MTSWPCSVSGDDDLAAVGRVVVAGQQTHLRQPVDVAADGRQADAQPCRQSGHPDARRALDEMQRLGLLHRHVEAQELRHVDLGGQLAHPLEGAR